MRTNVSGRGAMPIVTLRLCAAVYLEVKFFLFKRCQASVEILDGLLTQRVAELYLTELTSLFLKRTRCVLWCICTRSTSLAIVIA